MKRTLIPKLAFMSVLVCAALECNVFGASGTWTNNGSANWSATSSWLSAIVADGAGNMADFSSVNITGARTVTLDSSRTIGTLKFADMTTADNDWTLGVANNAVLTLSGTPTFNVTNRTVTINPVVAGTEGFTKVGGGALAFASTANTFSGKIYLNAGTTRFKATGSLGVDPGAYLADAITLGGGIIMNNDSILVISPNFGITLTGSGGIQAGWSRPVTVDSPIAGSGNLTIQSDSTPGVISLNAANTYSGTTAVSGWLQLNGSLDAANAVTVNSGGVLMGTGTVNGPVTVASGGNIAAGGLCAPGTLTLNGAVNLNGGTLHADLSTPTGANDLIVVNGDLTLSGTVTVSFTPLTGTLAAGSYRLINYTGGFIGSAANFVAAPSRYSITFDTSTAGQVNMVVADGGPATLVWNGNHGLNWDLNLTPNWFNAGTPDTFRNGDHVLLDDSGNSVMPVTIIGPMLVNTLVPGSVTVDSAKDYTLTGGRLGGPMTLTKKGSSLLILTGNGSLPNYFDGPVIVEAGRLRLGYARALGNTNGGTFVRAGAALDVNGQDLGFEAISIEGAGPDGTGALINMGGGQNNALRLVTMTGDATVGGTGRFDIRNVEGIAALDTGGHAYKLTKKGANQFSLVGVTVDPALGEVDIQEGVFGFETTSTLGDAITSITIGYNASIRFWNLNNGFYKPLVLKGGTTIANLDNGSGSSTIIGPVTNLAQSVWNVAGTSMRVSSDVTGAGGITKTGGSPLYLDGVNTYAGPTVISAGSLVLGSAASISNSPSITLGGSTTAFDVSAPAAASLTGAFELNNDIGQSLSGSGTVIGNLTLHSGSSLVVGTSVGTLTNSGTLKLEGATAVFELGATTNVGTGASDLVVVRGDLTLAGSITLKVNALAPLDTVNPYTIALYSGTLDTSTADITVISDSRYTFTVDPLSAPGSIRLWAAPAGTGAETLTWQGNVSGSETLWDIKSTSNWSNSLAAADMFYLGDRVTFDDTAIGTAVSVTGTMTPTSLTISNETKDFVFSGAGKLSGVTGIVKQGAGKLTIANNGVNDNTGLTAVTAGTLEVGNGGTGGNLNSLAVTNTGTLVFNRSDDITVANAIGGAGKLEKKGRGLMVLSAAQPNLTGPVTVSEGTLRPGTATSLGTVAGGTIVTNGGSLDVNGLNLGAEVVTVSGAGVNGQGAIINSGAGQNNAFQYVVLAGDTVFGGPNRWDIRAGTSPYLNTGGNPFNLTKLGANQLSLVGVTVDNALADIDVKAGIFSYESTTTGLGNPARSLTIRSNATFQFWGASVPVNKQVYLEGGSTVSSGSGTANTISGPITLVNGMVNLNSGSSITTFYTGPMSGPGGIVTSGAGSVHLVGANTFAGNIVHNYGNLVLSNSLAAGSAKTLTVNYNTAVSSGAGVRLFLRNGITTPEDLVGIFRSSSLGGDYRCSITSDVLTNTWAGPMLLQGSAIVAFYRNEVTNLLNVTGPILGTNGFTGTAFFRGTAGLCGRISGRVQIPTGIMGITDNTAWQFTNPDNLWFRTMIAYGKVILGADNAACPTAELVLGQTGSSSGTLDLNGYNQTVPSITTINGANHWITNGSATADSVFTFNGGTNVSVLNGRIADGTRKLALTVTSGILNLLGNNTYKGDTIVSGGTLGLGSTAMLATTPRITVGAGATLDTGALPSGLTLASGQTLTGNGTVQGSLTVGAGSTFSPSGATIGEFTLTGGLTLAGTNIVELNSSATPSSDLVTAGSVVYGGTLVVQNLGPVLVAGNSFKLFSASAYSGAFTGIIPDKPGAGLAWDTNKLVIDGTLSVLQGIPSTPTNITASVSDNTLTLTWPADYTGWRLEAQTNSGLTSIWFEVPGSATTNQMSFPIDPAQPAVFYRLGYTP